jgi:CheY-like chemotaxis protein
MWPQRALPQGLQTLTQAFVATHPLRVLVAEDDGELRSLIAASLRCEGFPVLEAGSGLELLDVLGSTLVQGAPPPDLIVSDVHMPGTSGLQVLGGLRRAGWGLPVILITAFGDAALHDEAHRLGASAVFDKPFDLDDLTTAVLNFASAR